VLEGGVAAAGRAGDGAVVCGRRRRRARAAGSPGPGGRPGGRWRPRGVPVPGDRVRARHRAARLVGPPLVLPRGRLRERRRAPARAGGRARALRGGAAPPAPVARPVASAHSRAAPGDVVRVRSRGEILGTLDLRGKNRGLRFDREMLPYCGQTRRVARRVERFIDEASGELVELKSDCVVLDGVVCRGFLSYGRWFCPRAISPWWREAWLEPVARGELQADDVGERQHAGERGG